MDLYSFVACLDHAFPKSYHGLKTLIACLGLKAPCLKSSFAWHVVIYKKISGCKPGKKNLWNIQFKFEFWLAPNM